MNDSVMCFIWLYISVKEWIRRDVNLSNFRNNVENGCPIYCERGASPENVKDITFLTAFSPALVCQMKAKS